jgi:hypothetical protein
MFRPMSNVKYAVWYLYVMSLSVANAMLRPNQHGRRITGPVGQADTTGLGYSIPNRRRMPTLESVVHGATSELVVN